jgi:hypothetical protein
MEQGRRSFAWCHHRRLGSKGLCRGGLRLRNEVGWRNSHGRCLLRRREKLRELVRRERHFTRVLRPYRKLEQRGTGAEDFEDGQSRATAAKRGLHDIVWDRHRMIRRMFRATRHIRRKSSEKVTDREPLRRGGTAHGKGTGSGANRLTKRLSGSGRLKKKSTAEGRRCCI